MTLVHRALLLWHGLTLVHRALLLRHSLTLIHRGLMLRAFFLRRVRGESGSRIRVVRRRNIVETIAIREREFRCELGDKETGRHIGVALRVLAQSNPSRDEGALDAVFRETGDAVSLIGQIDGFGVLKERLHRLLAHVDCGPGNHFHHLEIWIAQHLVEVREPEAATGAIRFEHLQGLLCVCGEVVARRRIALGVGVHHNTERLVRAVRAGRHSPHYGKRIDGGVGGLQGIAQLGPKVCGAGNRLSARGSQRDQPDELARLILIVNTLVGINGGEPSKHDRLARVVGVRPQPAGGVGVLCAPGRIAVRGDQDAALRCVALAGRVREIRDLGPGVSALLLVLAQTDPDLWRIRVGVSVIIDAPADRVMRLPRHVVPGNCDCNVFHGGHGAAALSVGGLGFLLELRKKTHDFVLVRGRC